MFEKNAQSFNLKTYLDLRACQLLKNNPSNFKELNKKRKAEKYKQYTNSIHCVLLVDLQIIN